MKRSEAMEEGFDYTLESVRVKIVEVIEHVPVKYEDIRITYVIGCDVTNRVKIGITEDIERRLGELQAMSSTKLTVKYWFYSDGSQLEAHLHRKFNGMRLHGKWFAWDADMDAYLKQLNWDQWSARPRNKKPASSLVPVESGAN